MRATLISKRKFNILRLRTLALITTAMLVTFMIGCGSDEEEPFHPMVEKTSPPPLGLHEDTYRNQRDVFKVSHLPVDDWTVLVESNPADAVKIREWDEEFATAPPSVRNNLQTHLLMQPTTDHFQATASEAIENQMPFIFLSIEAQTVSEATSAKQIAELYIAEREGVFWEVTSQGEIASTDHTVGYFVNAMIYQDGSQIAHTFFVRSQRNAQRIYRFLYWAPADQYDKFKPIYDSIISSFELNTL